MIRSFAGKGTEDLYDGSDTRAARQACPKPLWPVARRKLDMVQAASRLDALKVPPGNRLERLTGNRKGQWAIRINDQYRICFRWEGQDAFDVRITDYH